MVYLAVWDYDGGARQETGLRCSRADFQHLCLGWTHLGVVRSRQTTLSRLQFDNYSPPELLDTVQLLRFLW
jgi:hypothetical protein